MSPSTSSPLSRPTLSPTSSGLPPSGKLKGPREGRSLIACQRCRRLKKKCKAEEGRARCERCRITDQTCSYVPVPADEKKRSTSPSHSEGHYTPEPSPEPVTVDNISYGFPPQNGGGGYHSHSSQPMINDVYPGVIHGRFPYEHGMLLNGGILDGANTTDIYYPSNATPARGFSDTSPMSHLSRPSLPTCNF